MLNMPIRLIAILPMLLLVAALIAMACESAPPDDASQDSAIAAAAPTTTPTPTATATPEHTQTPTAMPDTHVSCEPGDKYPEDSLEADTCIFQVAKCPPDSFLELPVFIQNGMLHVTVCNPPPTPTPVYQNLTGGLSKVAEAYEKGASAQSAASSVFSGQALRDNLLTVVIYIDRDPKELVIWLNDNGAEFGWAHGTALVDEEWLEQEGGDIDDHYATVLLDEYIRGETELEKTYEGGTTKVVVGVPVSLLVGLSQQPGVIEVTRPVPAFTPDQPASRLQSEEAVSKPSEIVDPTAAPIETQGLSAHGVRSWQQAGYKGSGVKV